MITQKFTITKKIAKHGNQAVIIIPALLTEHLNPGTIVQLEISILEKFIEAEKLK